MTRSFDSSCERCCPGKRPRGAHGAVDRVAASLGTLVARLPGRHGLVSMLGPNGLRVVLYHNITAEPGPCVDGLGVTVSPEVWAEHLDYYVREYSVVDLETVLHGRLPKRPLLITFDDGYRSLLETAAPQLRQRGLPAVFFAVSGMLGNRRLMLDNVLAYLTNTLGLERVERAITGRAGTRSALPAVLEEVVAPLPYGERLGLAERLVAHFELDEDELLRRYRLYLEPSELLSLAELGVEIGCHTASHVHCRCLGPTEAQREIVDAAAALTKLVEKPVRAFSSPYGSELDATTVVRDALRASGQEIAFLVDSGTNGRRHVGQNWSRVAMDWPGPHSPFARLEILPRLAMVRRMRASRGQGDRSPRTCR
jgi:peptidoglycan/xylan/chitin deacetylase (PgdA/CDA1 family)